jgi:acetyltransferase-like isoleucine patch superfamily enzyme
MIREEDTDYPSREEDAAEIGSCVPEGSVVHAIVRGHARHGHYRVIQPDVRNVRFEKNAHSGGFSTGPQRG